MYAKENLNNYVIAMCMHVCELIRSMVIEEVAYLCLGLTEISPIGFISLTTVQSIPFE